MEITNPPIPATFLNPDESILFINSSKDRVPSFVAVDTRIRWIALTSLNRLLIMYQPNGELYSRRSSFNENSSINKSIGASNSLGTSVGNTPKLQRLSIKTVFNRTTSSVEDATESTLSPKAKRKQDAISPIFKRLSWKRIENHPSESELDLTATINPNKLELLDYITVDNECDVLVQDDVLIITKQDQKLKLYENIEEWHSRLKVLNK